MPDPKHDPSNPAAAAAQALSKAARPAAGEGPDAQVMPAKPKDIELRRYDFKLLESVNNQWMGIAPRGTTPEDFAEAPAVGALIGDQLTRFDDVRLVSADGAWLADYIVADCARGYGNLVLLRSIKLPPRRTDAEARVPSGYQIRQGLPGEQPGYLAIRLSNGLVMNAGVHLLTFEACLRFLIDHSALRRDDNGNLAR